MLPYEAHTGHQALYIKILLPSQQPHKLDNCLHFIDEEKILREAKPVQGPTD